MFDMTKLSILEAFWSKREEQFLIFNDLSSSVGVRNSLNKNSSSKIASLKSAVSENLAPHFQLFFFFKIKEELSLTIESWSHHFLIGTPVLKF